MLNFETDTTNMNNDLVRQNNNNNITTLELEGETIDLTQKNNSNVINVSDIEANQVTMVSSVDTSNRYVNEFPITAGFNESVYA